VANNVEETQLRYDSIELLIDLCTHAPKVASQVGIVRQLIECMQDVTLEQFKYQQIVHALMLLINDPKIRVYFRPFIDLNRIFTIFTRPDGVDKDPKKKDLDRILA
jgi:hypothetical protein